MFMFNLVLILCNVGFVIGRSKSSRGDFTALLNLQKLKLTTHNGVHTATSSVQKKKFIVKVQVPMSEFGVIEVSIIWQTYTWN
jgi:hypothetical protein